MNPLLSTHRGTLLFAALTGLLGLVAALLDWRVVLDGLSALVALFAAVAVCARLSFPASAGRRSWWLLILALLAVAAIGQFLAPLLGSGRVFIWGNLWQLIALLGVLLVIMARVARARDRANLRDRQPKDVGDLARYLFTHSNLFHKQRYPRIGNFVIPGGAAGLALARFFAWYFPAAGETRKRAGVGLFRQFRDLCAIFFRHGLDAQSYYMFELYRPEMRARASGYLTRYETKNGIIKVLNRQLPKYGKRTPLGDKRAMQELCAANGIPNVPTLVFAEKGALAFPLGPDVALERDLFLKPQQLKGARGTEVVRYADGAFVTRNGVRLTRAQLLDHVASRSREAALLVQPYIRCHPDLARLGEQSLPPLRLITCLDGQGKPVVTHGMMRVLCKLEPTWPSDVELGAPVELATGILGALSGDKPEMAFDRFAEHPFTGLRVAGLKVPYWEEAQQIALAAHALCPDRLFIGWDIAITATGAVMLEGNSYADVDFPQRVHAAPIGDSPLGPLLFQRLVEIERRIAEGTLQRSGLTA